MDGDLAYGRMEGDIVATFTVNPPPADISRAQIAVNELRSLPEAIPRRGVVIVGSGPSARDEGLWARIRRERPKTVALNGALGLFLDRGLKPHWWCACDPQELVANFLPQDPPYGITYLPATKCHPAVFERLKGRDVRKWRIDDYSTPEDGLCVPCACSITLVSQGLFRLRGFTTFEMYGWDCCFLDGEHHASKQDAPLPEHCQPVELRRASDNSVIERFETTGGWMAETEDAATQAGNFRAMGLEMIIHGPGMVGAVLKGRGLAK